MNYKALALELGAPVRTIQSWALASGIVPVATPVNIRHEFTPAQVAELKVWVAKRRRRGRPKEPK